MLIKLAVSNRVGGLHLETIDGTEYIINPNRIKELEAYDTTGSQFLYVWNPEDETSDSMYFQSTESVADIITAADDAPVSAFVALSVYEDDDTTEDPVTKYFRVDDIVFAADYSNYVWIWISQGAKKVTRYLVYHDLDAILNLANTGTTTTWLLE